MQHTESVQERYAPQNACFGCGQANEKGLRLRSIPSDETADAELVCAWSPEPHHAAFGNVLNGGIVGVLFDCHSNWTAAWHLLKRDGLEQPPCTVTADFHVRLERPTALDQPLRITARAVASEGERVTVEAEMTSGGRVTATCRGTFVAVEPGHPAYHRW